MRVGEKIDFLLKKTAMTKVELAEKLGLKDSSAVSHWVKNRSLPEPKNVQKMSVVFDKPVSYFSDDITYGEMENLRGGGENTIHTVGVIGGVYKNSFVLSLYSPAEEYLPVFIETKNNIKPFALKIHTKDVFSSARVGDYAIIVPAQEASEGKTALIRKDGFSMLREVFYEKNFIVLKDGKKQSKHAASDVEITGVVMGFFRK